MRGKWPSNTAEETPSLEAVLVTDSTPNLENIIDAYKWHDIFTNSQNIEEKNKLETTEYLIQIFG